MLRGGRGADGVDRVLREVEGALKDGQGAVWVGQNVSCRQERWKGRTGGVVIDGGDGARRRTSCHGGTDGGWRDGCRQRLCGYVLQNTDAVCLTG